MKFRSFTFVVISSWTACMMADSFLWVRTCVRSLCLCVCVCYRRLFVSAFGSPAPSLFINRNHSSYVGRPFCLPVALSNGRAAVHRAVCRATQWSWKRCLVDVPCAVLWCRQTIWLIRLRGRRQSPGVYTPHWRTLRGIAGTRGDSHADPADEMFRRAIARVEPRHGSGHRLVPIGSGANVRFSSKGGWQHKLDEDKKAPHWYLSYWLSPALPPLLLPPSPEQERGKLD